jgi:hypothetical protein
MKGRLKAVSWFLAGASLFLAPAAFAVTVNPVQMPIETGVSGPLVVAPMGIPGASLQNGVGPLDTKGTLSHLPVAPGLAPEKAEPSFSPDVFPLILPDTRMSLRPAAAPPALPASAIPGAVDSQSSQEDAPPAPAATAYSAETLAEANFFRGLALGKGLPGGTLQPEGGGQLPMLRRQSLRIAAKADAVSAQMSAAADLRNVTDEGAQDVGQRVAAVLMDDHSVESKDVVWPTDSPMSRPSGSGAQRLVLFHGSTLEHGMPVGADAGWSSLDAQASIRKGNSESPGLGKGVASALSVGLKEGVPLIALRIRQQSLAISVVPVPIGRLAMRWARDASRSFLAAGPSLSEDVPEPADLRDAVASYPAASAGVIQADASAGHEIFSFLQTTGEGAAAGMMASGTPGRADGAEAPSDSNADATSTPRLLARFSSERRSQSPLRTTDPLAVTFLPLIGIGLLLRSRLFS